MKSIIKKLTAVMTAACLIFMTACSLISGAILPFEGKKLLDGKVGVAYEASIATGTEDMYYDLDYDSNLPSGLILYDTGIIKGVPKESGTFDFKAVMIDLNDNEYYADFSIYIEAGELVYNGGVLDDTKAGEPYSQNLATATGMDKISYKLKDGCVLPAGLALSEEGVLSGIPEAAGDASIVVVASAPGCAAVEATFTFNIAEGQKKDENLGVIIFEDFTLPDGMVGESYSQSIRRAYGVADISYSFRFSSGKGLPTGLKADKTLGMISGIPKDSTEGSITFRVTASAEGCESVTAYVTLTVYDPYVKTNRFETEYVDTIPHLSGAGYSSAPSGRGMIQKTPLCSNGAVLGYLNKPVDIVYTIYADEATTAKLTIGLGSDNGNVTYDPSMFAINVNGSEINYGTISFEQKGTSEATYETTACTIAPVINLQKGVNTITFSIKQSDKATGTYSAVGCLFDYIELTETSCDLGWRPRLATPTEEDRTVEQELIDSMSLEAYIGSGTDVDIDKPWYSERKPRQKRKELSASETKYKIYDLIGKDYNDKTWDFLLNQLTYKQMAFLIGTGNYHTSALENIGLPYTTSADGPAGLANFMTVTESTAIVYDACFYACECIVAATWNIELAEAMGVAIGDECLVGNERGDGMAYTGWYAPAVNIHRSQFGGRNWEYYSEDPFISGVMAANVVQGAKSKGVNTYVKHFAVNDQDTNRDTNGLVTWLNEQSLREIYLRPFEMAVKDGKTLAMMTSFNRIGTVWAGGCYELVTDILRHEWGFVGAVLTDYNTSSYMYADQMIRAGGDINLMQDKRPSTSGDIVNPSHQTAMRKATKNILYMLVNSNAMNGLGEGIEYRYTLPVWQMVMLGVDVTILAILGVSSIVRVVQYKNYKKRSSQKTK